MTELSTSQVGSFKEDGFLVIKNLFEASEVKEMRDACDNLVEKLDPEKERAPVFKTADSQRDRGDYFLTSGDKIRYFYETAAVDDEGRLKNGMDKFKSINKIGHALHVLEPTFKKYTFDQRVSTVVKQLGMTSPAVCQSMYIFKPPRVGGAVPPHLDATYLYTRPLGKVIGVWIALEDANIENSCLWFIPGSHKEVQAKGDVPVRFVRVPDDLIEKEGCMTKNTGPNPTYEEDRFVPVPIKAGDAIIIHGLVVHKSEPNRTEDQSRHIYTFHVLEQNETIWDENNWLQPSKNIPFAPLFQNSL